jgi:hypothetical protein
MIKNFRFNTLFSSSPRRSVPKSRGKSYHFIYAPLPLHKLQRIPQSGRVYQSAVTLSDERCLVIEGEAHFFDSLLTVFYRPMTLHSWEVYDVRVFSFFVLVWLLLSYYYRYSTCSRCTFQK